MEALRILALAAAGAVAIVLLLGIGGFGKGGDFNRKYANKLMRLRLLLQFVALVPKRGGYDICHVISVDQSNLCCCECEIPGPYHSVPPQTFFVVAGVVVVVDTCIRVYQLQSISRLRPEWHALVRQDTSINVV